MILMQISHSLEYKCEPERINAIVEYFVVQIEEQVSDDELSLISWDELSRACSEDSLNKTPPALQSMALGTQATPHTVPLHHLLQDGVHLLPQKEHGI